MSMAYSLSNKCAKNLSKRTVLVQQLSSKIVVTCFFEHSVLSTNDSDSILLNFDSLNKANPA